mgnify:CR=1 FL=1
MEKITSFTINHLKLLPGVYVSRVDYVAGNPVTTFDLRMTAPNREPVMNTAEMHTIEHSSETIRNSVKKTSTSDLWAVVLVSTLYLQANISLATSFH